MTDKEVQNKLKTILGDYYYGKTSGKNSIRHRMNEFPYFELNKSIINKYYTRMLHLQNISSEMQDKDDYIPNMKKALFKYMRLGILIQDESKYYCFKNTFESGLKVADKLISRVARIEAEKINKYISEHSEFSLDEFLNNESCLYAYFMMDILDIIDKTYVSSSTREQLKKLIPKDPKDEYPEARKMKRHFIIHIGLTNTGKTYHSLERLKAVPSGAYLGPLRLLALEVQEKLNDAGVPCDMITGEEESIIPGAKHVASTVEKLNPYKFYDVCVIDECQLVSDETRGCFWVKAILGVQSPEIHLAAAPEALDILLKIIKSCNDTYEVINHERQTKLLFFAERYDIPKSIEQGDALIVFSRKNALLLGDTLTNMGIPTSVIYGALPYASRKEQLKRFVDGKTKVVVSTDAIGMGLNLPVKRIIFMEQEKFDGTEMRTLLPWEIKQIAGRAGRIGMYPEGHVLTTSMTSLIKNGLAIPNEDVKKAYVGFSDSIASIDGDLIKILKVWKSLPILQDYKKTDITRYINLDILLKAIFSELKVVPSKEDELKFLNIPFDEKNTKVLELWTRYVRLYLQKKPIKLPIMPCKYLDEWETYYKCLDLFYSFSKNFGYEVDKNELIKIKERTTTKIDELLLATLSTNKSSDIKKIKFRRNK